MAVFGHSGSHAPQLMHSLVMVVDIRDRSLGKPRNQSPSFPTLAARSRPSKGSRQRVFRGECFSTMLTANAAELVPQEVQMDLNFTPEEDELRLKVRRFL